ncbi:MAG: zinc ribbon domain-containing protein [Paraburkholderia sp.]|uniref:FmdB family zinc ribbon protein n=1 Tax=Paraburkholderia sp. TaxID=1926495 RepID=UPI0012048E9A|nr:zinc ribbon domain-containing protein [Paraburkholderia sp.]TAM08000.1 MAG: zinc ribbon domain-containing protein [Paraburkholderia sp.]TAM29514.1 MAG: zinc ribbon domain-containing protein [Paraburkholderia sp.]
MPIYAYRCESCGFEKDVLQKLSDAPLTQCTNCGAETFRKQVTAAGFQLKGSGWYVTDFRGGSSNGNGTSAAATGAKAAGESEASSGGGKPAGESAAAPAGSGTSTGASTSAASGTGTSTNTSATASTAGTT